MEEKEVTDVDLGDYELVDKDISDAQVEPYICRNLKFKFLN